MRGHAARRPCARLALLAMLVLPGVATAAPAPGRVVVRRTVFEADSLVLAAPNAAGVRVLAEWAKRAPIPELVWLLRRPSAELKGAEAVLLDAALASTPVSRTALRERLLARRAMLAPAKPARKGDAVLPSLLPLRPHASVYRVAVIAPDEGDYGNIGPVLRAAILDGLQSGRAAGALPFAMDSAATGDSDPARLAAAADSLLARSDVIVGELLSPPSIALATATHVTGAVLVSPTANDERIGRIGTRTFQLGPSAEFRGRRLAEQMCKGNPAPIVGVVATRAALASPFVGAFVAEAGTRTGRSVTQRLLPQDPAAISALARVLKLSDASVLMCEASARELEPLVRALAAEGAALRLCGGTALLPEGFRASARPLLEGVTTIDDSWRLAAPERARLDSLATTTGTRAGTVWTRGWLIGRAIARAIDGGACCASEVAAALRASDPWFAERGFLDVSVDGARLPLYTVHNGRSIALQ